LPPRQRQTSHHRVDHPHGHTHWLKVRAELDPASYPNGTMISDKKLASLNIKRHKFYGDWN
jgi:hypothetical protein